MKIYWKNKTIFPLVAALAGLLGLATAIQAQSAPDLTATNLALINTTRNYSLGPTGLRGWIFVSSSPVTNSSGFVYGRGVDESMTACQPYQVLVVTVGTNTPAAGVFLTNDVILGVNTGSGNLPVPLFTDDARKRIGRAISAAEAGDGWMNFKVWRAGVTNDVSIQLSLRALAYSVTAPYNCPKSSVILSNAINVVTNRSFNLGTPGNQVLGLALLAIGDTNLWPKVQTYARSITTVSGSQWDRGYTCVFLSEYYLQTGDTNVLPMLQAYLLNAAHGMDRYGTCGHSPAFLNDDGSYSGTSPGYGPVNCAGVTCALGMALGQKALVAAGLTVDPAVTAALARSANFFGWFVQKGSIPYGEHNPWGGGMGYYHYSNGKLGLASLFFSLLDNQSTNTEYYVRMAMAGSNTREYGHTGQEFNYLWDALGVNVGGTNALGSYLQNVEWHMDLERRCDGSFVYDGAEQYGPSTVSDYWLVGGNNAYNGIDPTSAYVLTFATPRQQLYITGRNANPTNVLSSDKVTNAIWAASMPTNSVNLTTNQLFSALGEFDPEVRFWAAEELGTRPGISFASISNLFSCTNAWLRASACTVICTLKDTNSLSVLGQCLTDADDSVRGCAALALGSLTSSATPMLPTMLTAYTNNATNPNTINWNDPVQEAQMLLGVALFGDSVGSLPTVGGANTAAADKNLLYPAVRAGLQHPDSLGRGSASMFMKNYAALADVQALVPDLIQCATTPVLADPMWRANGRTFSIQALAKYYCPEAIPVGLAMQNQPWVAVSKGDAGDTASSAAALTSIATFGDSVRYLLPTLNNDVSDWGAADGRYSALASAVSSITTAVTSPVQTNLFPVGYNQVVVTTNAVAVTLTGFSCRTNALTYYNITPPVHGTLSGGAPYLTYTPTPGYTGLDSFTFQVADSMTNSAPATVSLIVGTPAGAGLKGQYYDNMDFTNLKFTRIDPQINFDWGAGTPSNSIAANTYSVRWTGLLLAPETGYYTFSTLNSDGVRLYVNGTLMIDDWSDQPRQWSDGSSIYLTAGQQYPVQMDYYKDIGDAVIKLKWTGPSFAGANGVIIGKEWLYDGSVATNLPVFAYAQSVTMLQNTNALIALEGSVTATNFSIGTGPAHGSLGGTPPLVTYTPTTNYNGTDSFTFTTSDGINTSASATVAINILAGSPVSFYWTNTASGVWSAAANWTNSSGGSVAPNAAGQPYYSLQFNKAGTYSATNDLNSGFAVNQLNMAATLSLAGNNLNLTNNGLILPQINQNSASAVAINTPLNLAATTTLGGLGGGDVTVNSLISGAGGLVVNTPGNLKLMNATNTYTGGTVINAGVVSGPTGVGNPTPIFGTGPVTFNAAATFTVNRYYLTNAVTLNGATVTGGNAFGTTLAGPVTLCGVSTINFSGGFVISGNVGGTGGLISVGSATWTMSGTNSYTGPTTISTGGIKYTVAAAVAPGALVISNGAMANLSYSGNRTNCWLSLNGVDQPAGTYGSLSSTATYKSSYFTNNGIITVAPAVGSISNRPVANITVSAATLNANLNGNGALYTVVVYWGTNNAGTNAAAWGNSAVVGSWTEAIPTNISYAVAGLCANTQYYFTFRATNSLQSLWAGNIQNFQTLQPLAQSTTDIYAPAPNPASFAVPPTALGEFSIAMTAMPANDVNGVQYLFTETTGHPGGASSGWQSSPNYTNAGLNAGTLYTYTVTYRDLSTNSNVGTASAPVSVTTMLDTNPPNPNPMTFAVAPAAVNYYSVTMTATTATDSLNLYGVEYYFTCTAGGGHDSGWQDSTNYTDTGLTTNTQYSYTVKARDKSSHQNTTSPSSVLSATTPGIIAYWDGGSTNIAGNGDGVSAGGSGTWSSTIQNWDFGSGLAHGAWPSNSSAVFGGTAGTVSLATPVNVSGLQFDTANYVLNSNPLTLAGSGTIAVNANATINSVIAGTNGLTKSGTGTLTLSGVNTFSGAVVVSSNTLSIGNIANGGSASALGQSSASAANLLLGNGTTLTYTGPAASSDRLFTINGITNGSAVTLSGSGTGALNLTSTSALGYGAANQTRTLTLTGANAAFTNILAAQITDNGSGLVSLSKGSTGNIWWLTNPSNSFSGGLQFNGGFLMFSSGALGTSGAIQIGANAGPPMGLKWAPGNRDDISSRFNYTGNGSSGSATLDTDTNDVVFASAISLRADSWLIKAGSGSLTLNMASSWGGGANAATLVNAGTLVAKVLANGGTASSIGNIPNTSTALGLRGGTLKYTGAGSTNDHNFNLSGNNTIDASGSGPLVFSQTGALSPIPASRVFSLTSGSNKTGNAPQNSSDLAPGMAVSSTNGIKAGTTIVSIGMNGQITFNQNATNTVSSTLVFGGYPAGTLTLAGTNPGANEIKGMLQDSASTFDTNILSLTKTGTGKWILSGTNTYSGVTIVTAGTLALAGASALTKSSAITVAGGATLDVSGLSAPFSLGGSQTLSNSSPGAVISGTNNCSPGTLSLQFDGSNPCFIQTNGGMTLSTATVIKINNTGATLTCGTYTLIADTATGNVGYVAGAVTTNQVVVAGNGSFGPATLVVTGNKLVLTIAPPIISTIGTLSALGTTYGTASSATSFTVSGLYMSTGITVTPPVGYEVSSASGSGYAGSGNAITVGSAGTITNTTVYVRLATNATAVGSPYTGNIVCTSTGATSATVATAASTVASVNLTITGLAGTDKVYDGTVTAGVSGTPAYVGLQNSESFAVTGTPGFTFADKHVGTSKAITVIGYTAPSGNYTVSQPTGLTANITTKAVTVSAVTSSKPYDGTTSSSGTPTISPALASGDTTSALSQTFDTKNVGTGKTLAPAITINDGNSGNNYSVTLANNTSGVITAKAVTVTAVTDSKTYDGTPSSSGTPTISPALVGGDATSALSQAFDTKHIGTGKTLTPSVTINDGNSGNNYSVTLANNTTGVITAKAVTVTAVTDSKTYDGTTTSSGTPTISPALTSGDTTSALSQTFDTKHVGTGKTLTPAITINDGNSGNNYTVTLANNTSGVITAKAVTVTAVTDSKTYDGTTNSAGTPTISPALASGDATSALSQTFNTKNVGTGKTLIPAITINDGNSGNNYSVTLANNTNGVITALGLTVTAVTDSKTYDGTTTSVGVPTISPALASGDTTSVLSQSFNTKNVGTGKTLTPAITINDGNSGNNYTVTLANNTTGVITAKAVTVTAVTDSKTYDGTTSSAGTPTISPALASGDTTSALSQSFNTKNVGTGKTLAPSITINDGNSGNNYSITLANNTTGVITAKAVTVTAVTDSKTYDGATTSSGTPTISPALVNGDTTSVLSQSFNTKNVGTGKTLAPSITINDGNSGNNYSITLANNTTGVITAKAVTVTAVTDSKTYDGATTSSGTPTISPALVSGDTTSALSQTFDTKNVGTGKTLTPTVTINDGNGGNNYTVTLANNTTGAITTKAVTVTAATDSKTYDGTTSSAGTPTISPALVSGDTTSALNQTFDTKNVGTNKTLTPTVTINDGNGGNNYTVTLQNVASGTISAASLTITAQANTKVYDATTGATAVPTFGTVYTPDTVTGLAEAYLDANVGSNKTLVVTGYTVNDGNSGNNYSITLATNFSGIINPPTSIAAYWDGGAVNITTNGNGASAGTSGTWNTTIQNWDRGSGVAHSAWINNNFDIAVFGGTAGTVSLSAPVTVGGLQFDTANYVINSNTLTLAYNGTVAANANATVNSVITGANGLTKIGAGTLTLGGTNTFTGAVVISSNTLSIGNIANGGSPSALGQSSASAANLVLGNGATLNYTGSGATSDRLFTMSGSVNLNGAGTGALLLTNTGAIGFGAANQAGILNLGGAQNLAITNILAAQITDNGTGLVQITHGVANNVWWLQNPNNNFSGGVIFNRGNLIFSSGAFGTNGLIGLSANAVAPVTLTWASGNSDDISKQFNLGNVGNANSVYTLVLDVGTNNVNFANGINPGRASTGLVKDGPGSLTMNGTNQWAGNSSYTAINAGTLAVTWLLNGGSNDGLGGAPAGAQYFGLHGVSTFKYIGPGSTNDHLFNITGTNTLDASGTGPLVFTNLGIISPTVPSRSFAISSNNTATGNAPSSYGDLVVGQAVGGFGVKSGTVITSIGNNGQLTISQATTNAVTNLLFGAYNIGPFTLAGTNTGNNQIKGRFTDSVSGIDSSSVPLSLIKAGTGTWILSGTNTYSGNTTINGGTLALSGSGSITNSSSIVVASNAIFNVSGLSSAFTLAQALSSQTLSNSAPGAIINGTNNCSAGTISLLYDGVHPCFIQTNGGMTLSAGTSIKINNTGATLAAGSYTLVTNTTAGNAGFVVGTVTSAVTVGGNGASGTATLSVTGNQLVLTVASGGMGPIKKVALQTMPQVKGQFSTQKTGGTQFTVTYTGTIGQTYVVQRSTDLVKWANLATNVMSTTTATYTDTAPPSPPVFYRVVPVP